MLKMLNVETLKCHLFKVLNSCRSKMGITHM